MKFQREQLTVNRVPIVMLTAGAGEPLLFFHGAGTFHEFDFALPWAEHFRVMIPYHPNWGASCDAPEMDTIGDYMLHYLELIDQLRIDRAHLVGLSMGGRFAATFGYEHRRRVNKLVLVAPAGIHVPGYPVVNPSTIPPDQILHYLAYDKDLIERLLPRDLSDEYVAARMRERASFDRIVASGLISPKVERWLHRLTMPTMLIWGEHDRIIPAGQAEYWAERIPGARVKIFPEAGHLVLHERPEAVQAISDFLRN
jgi:pimeloyl-ACP methyl ester carboxylesterase